MATWQSLFVEKINDNFGYVNTIQEAERLTEAFFLSTTSKFVLYKVDAKFFGNTDFKAKSHKLLWEFDNSRFHSKLPYDGTPFMRVNMRVLNCQFGMDKSGKKRKEIRAKKMLETETNEDAKKGWVSFISKKRDCPANVTLLEIIKFPDFTLEADSEDGRRYVSQYFFTKLKEGDVKSERRIYIALPQQSDHQFHPFENETKYVPRNRSNVEILNDKCRISRTLRIKQTIRAAIASKSGSVEDISVKRIPISMYAKSDEIVINVFASAANRQDIVKDISITSVGQQIIGCEAAGIVYATGNKASKWKNGDRVMAYLHSGGCADKVTVHQDHVMSVPTWMTLSSAAALPQAWLTAYNLLCHEASMKHGDIVLIHAGASGVGTALVQLVTMAGGVAIVTAGSDGKIGICKSLGASAGFNYKSLDFAKDLTNHLNGKRVHLIFDPVGGTHWQLNSNIIGQDGTWIIYGLLSGPYIAGDMRPLLKKNVTIKTSLLKNKSNEHIAELATEFTKDVLPYFLPNDKIQLSPVINKFYPLEEIKDAYSFLESNETIGKLIINIKDEDMSKVGVPSSLQNRKNVEVPGTCSQLEELAHASSQLLEESRMLERRKSGLESPLDVFISSEVSVETT